MKWETRLLGELTNIKTGKLNANAAVEGGRHPFFTCSRETYAIDEYAFDCEAILLAGNNAVGDFNVKHYKGKFNAYQRTYVITIKNETEVLYRFLYIQIQMALEKFKKQSVGAGTKFLKIGMINSLVVFTPPIEEQKRIVAILEQVFADIDKARATAEKNLKNARELFDSYLQQVFRQRGEGWVDTSLGNICNFQNGYAFKSKDTVEISNTQLIRMGNLYQNILDLNRKSVFYPDHFSDEYEQFKLKEGDMIISLTGTVGKEDYGYTVEIPRTDKTLLLNQRIAKITSIDMKKLDKRFLLRTLRSRVFLDKLYSTANGTRQANLSTTTMKDILISIPSLDKQLELCRDFDKLEVETLKLARIYSKKLVDLDELKKSILQKAFTGELTKSKGIAA